ncbi:unnamed protein product [Clonostachys solani]|uniref:Uncharacterized protein n=1 Tax=Clonostachys solani TaxID=160281 RepID=A0A9N9ZKQ1_9HYPO|nr:unnamed protein product [Clonostachys solani]
MALASGEENPVSDAGRAQSAQRQAKGKQLNPAAVNHEQRIGQPREDRRHMVGAGKEGEVAIRLEGRAGRSPGASTPNHVVGQNTTTATLSGLHNGSLREA